MKIESAEDIYELHSDLKSDMKIVQKMFREAYKEEMAKTKKFDKILESELKSNHPIKGSDLVVCLMALNKQIARLQTEQYIQNRMVVDVFEKSFESVIAINAIIPIMIGFAKENENKDTQKKLKEIEKQTRNLVNFKKKIIKSVKQKQAKLKKQESKKSKVPSIYG